MQARAFIEQIILEHPGIQLSKLLVDMPELLEEIRRLRGRIRWARDTPDGRYIIRNSRGAEFYYQERGAALWGEGFPSEAEAVAWAFAEGFL